MKRSVSTLIILSLFSKKSFSQNTDLILLKSINQNEYSQWDAAMKITSTSVFPFAGLSAGGILLVGYINKDKELMRSGCKTIIAIAAAVLFTEALKYSVQRPRPFVTYPNDIVMRTDASDYSFPSGHTYLAFATATSLTLSTKKWYVAVPAYLLASFIGYSRMRLGVHYPSDVLCGAILGAGTALLTWQIDKWMRNKKKKNSDKKEIVN